MKNNILLLLLLVTVTIKAQKGQGIFIYKKDFSEFSLSSSKSDSLTKTKMNKFIEVLIEKGSSVDFTLKINKKESLFFLNERLTKDNDRTIRYAIGVGDTNGIFYMNLESKEILNSKESYGQDFIVSSSLDDRFWKMTNESRKIGNYNCFKATSVKVVENLKGVFKHVVEAWFTPQIPLNFGPAGYGGLPGLIMELKFQNIRFYLTKIELNPKDEIYIKKPTKGKLVTKKEFNEIGKEITKNFKKGF